MRPQKGLPYGAREIKGSHADQRAERVYGCPTGKFGYVSKARAKRALKEARRAGRSVTAVYDCPMCVGFHITSQPQVPR